MLWSNFFLGKVSLQGWEGVCQFVFPRVWEWLEHLVIHRPARTMFLAFGSRTTCICTYMSIFIVIYIYICIYTFDSFFPDDFCWCQKWVRPPFAVGKVWGCQTASLMSILNEKLLHSVKLTAKATEKRWL